MTRHDIQVLTPPVLSTYQYYMQWFVSACERGGYKVKKNITLPYHVRAVVAKFKLSNQIYGGRSILVVPCGGFPDYAVFPYGYMHEIVPMIWDCWPKYWERMISSFKRHKIKLAFFTASQVVEFVRKELPNVTCVHIPEGINIDGYKSGKALKERSIDLLELGRVMPNLHKQLEAGMKGLNNHVFNRPGASMAFSTFEALTEGLSDSKIVVSFPRCDTNPEHAGNVETLTQRYWECMLSRTIIYGRAPKELIEFLGYNPVITADMNNVQSQLEDTLADIDSYQKLVDKNYEIALKLAPWDTRVPMITKALTDKFQIG